MLEGDGPIEDARAEIIEVTNQPIPWAPDAPARPGAEPDEAAARARLGRRRAATAVAGLVAIVALVVIAGQAHLFSAPLPQTLPSNGPTPVPSTTFPAQVAGLPVIGVAAASAQYVAGATTSSELAVGGWYTARETLAVCHPTGQPYTPCGELWTTRLLSSATPLYAPDGSTLPQAPGVSALETIFVTPVRKPDLPVTNPLEVHPTIDPTALVLVGHFHDDRAGQCGTSSPQALGCGPVFVVDAVADLTGVVRTSGPTATGLDPALTAADVVTRIRAAVRPGGVVLEFGPVVWFADGINFSPVEQDPSGPPVDSRYVWLVRGYLAGAPSWLAIDDVSGRMWGPLAAVLDAPPVADGLPDQIEGLAVQSVGGVLQAVPRCCQLVAIGGYLTNDRAPDGCPPQDLTGKPNPCSNTHLAMIDKPDPILEPNDATFLYDLAIPLTVPAIRPLILSGTTAPDPWAGLTGLADRVGPRLVILVGQFADPRSPECAPRPGGGNAGCDLSFVVDQVAWMNGAAQPASVWTSAGLSPIHSPGEIDQVINNFVATDSDPAIVSMTATSPADSAALTGIDESSQQTRVVWVVRYTQKVSGSVIVSGFAVVDDATEAIVDAGE